MKTTTFLAALLCLFCAAATAQPRQTDSRPRYDTWVTSYPSQRIISGVLLEVKDSSVSLQRAGNFRTQAQPDMSKLDIRSIDLIRVRKKGAVGQGVLYGALAGLFVGGVIDVIWYSSWKNKQEEEINNLGDAINYSMTQSPGAFAAMATMVGIGCIGTGIGIGAAVASAKITIPIYGKQAEFDRNKAQLNDYALYPDIALGSRTFVKLQEKLTDADGNSYQLLALGGQVWMAENLKTGHFRDGSEISPEHATVAGKVIQYKWTAVSDNRKLCPAGWHVPTAAEWNSLVSSLGGAANAAKILGEGFSVPGAPSNWWSATEQDAGNAGCLYLNNTTATVMSTTQPKSSGLAVRCLRD
jgi:hypothetical protein